MNARKTADGIDLLRHHGVLPSGSACGELASRPRPGDDLLAFLLRAWTRSLEHSPTHQQRRTAARVLTWLKEQAASGAELSWGLPGQRGRRVRDYVGERLIWWPRGMPQGEWVGVVSSRLGRFLDERREWFSGLRQTCKRLDPDHMMLATVEKTSTCPFLERCSQLFQIPLLRFELPRSRRIPAGWFPPRQHAQSRAPASAAFTWPAVVSPRLDHGPGCEAPARDTLLVAASDRLCVLRMRSGGNIERLVRRRIEGEPGGREPVISLLIGAELVPERLARTLPGTTWLEVEGERPRGTTCVPLGTRGQPARILAPSEVVADDHLIHCTRHAAGPWPDELVDDYHDALILGRDDADHGALATLARVVRGRKLLASSQAIRGGTPVVCFTAVDLLQLGTLHAFRAHRGRWDFEPYGICIERRWLETRGTRRVRYGDASLWDQLAPSERPFFQKRRGGAGGQLDWTVEREWRHVGDIDLTDLPPDAAVLFVPTMEEARQLNQLSCWPIVSLEDARE